MLRRLFAPSIFEDEEKTRTAQILNTFGWVAFVVVLLVTVSRILSNQWLSVSSRIFFPSLLFILLFTQVLIRNGYVRTAGGFMVSLIWLALTYQASQSDGLRDVAILAYSILVLLAALLLGWFEGLITGVLSLVMIWVFAFLENTGIRQYSVDPPLSYARDFSAVFIITSVLTSILIQRLNRSLSDAKLELRERLRADEKLQMQARYLTALHETTFGLLNRLELKPLLESILLRAGELLETPHVGIDLASLDEAVLRQEIGNGIFQAWNGAYTQKGEGLTGKVWERGETLVVEDYETWDGRNPETSGMGFYSVVGTPLKLGDKTLGVLIVASIEKGHLFSPEKVALLEKLAALASLAIDNARLYEKAQRELRERQVVEEDLRSSEGRFRKVFNNGSIAIAIVTLEEGIFLEANQAFWKLTGLTPEQALGRSAVDLELWAHPEDRAQFVKDLLKKSSLKNIEVEFPAKNGQSRPSLAYYELIDIKGQHCILCMFYDITEQRQAQRSLREGEARTRAIIASIPDMIFEVSKDGVFLDFMASADLIPVMEPHEFIGRNIQGLFPPGIGEQTMFSLERALTTGQVHAFEYGLPPGEEIQFFEARVAPVTSESAIIMVRDISQRKWVETEREKLINELEDKNAESETLRESMAIIAETLDETRAVSLILEQLEKVVPCNSASVQLLRNGFLEIVSTLQLEPKEAHLGQQYRVDESEPSYELLIGALPYVLLEDVQAASPRFKEAPHDQIRTWLAVPLRIKRKIIGIITLDGYRVGQFTKKDAELAVTYANQVAIALENARLFSELQTELAERKSLIGELESKNAELERFTYTVSHDLKSPVITIRGFLGFLEQDALSGNLPRLQSDIQRISDATDKMQTLLNELLDLSRVGRLVNPPRLVPFNEIVFEALDLVQGRIQANHVQVQIQEGMDAVYVDRQRMVEAVQNLIDNAAKFIGDDPRVEIGQEGREGGLPIFFIRDNGIGIPPRHHERIFGLFNKLDASSEGTGIGLALVRRIVEVHKGRIWVQSEPGKGSTFFFTLPTGP
ncbi:MAG: PAS domain S-box protein [Chloroflexi bacterium]|nr:PAS domain S-box protein [Chloroflexota bacterium]